MKILLTIIMRTAIYIVLFGNIMFNSLKKLSDILTSDETLTILRVIIYSCLFILLSLVGAVLAPIVIYVIVKEYIVYGQFMGRKDW